MPPQHRHRHRHSQSVQPSVTPNNSLAQKNRTNMAWNDITHVAFQILQPTTFWKIFFKVSQSICPDNTFLPWDLYRFYFMCHKWFYGWWCLSHTTSCSFYAFYVPPTPWLMYNSKYATTAKYSRLSLHVMYTPLFPKLCLSNVFKANNVKHTNRST